MNYWNELKYFFKKIGILRIIPSKYYLSYLYKKITGEKLNLKAPASFNEKLQWLKLYDKNPSYTSLVDKYAVREYVKEKIGDKYLIPLLGGPWYSADEIDFEALPDQFVLKCTHDSGSVIICEDKSKFDISAAKKKLNRCLKIKFFYLAREWPYKNVPPAIIAEKYMTDETGYELKDYKVFTFNGIPKLIQVDYDRFQNHKRNLYNTEWEYLPAQIQYPTDSSIKIERPKRLEEMLKAAEKLSNGLVHVRIDFYSIEDRLYFGEMTFYHGGGFEIFTPKKFEYEMGNWITLPSKNHGGKN